MVSRLVGRVVGLEYTGVANAYEKPAGCIAAGCPNMRELTVAVRIALLTATPVRGALFCSEAAPPMESPPTTNLLCR